MKYNDDHGNEQPIEPVDLNIYWDRVKKAQNELDQNDTEAG